MPNAIPEPTRLLEVARLELSRLAPASSLDHIFRRACEISANALHVERVGVWLFIDNRRVLRCVNLYERSKNEHSSGTLLHVADFPKYFQSLTIRKAVPAERALSEPWTAELADAYLRPLGISSMLDAGIFVDGQMVGAICHEHVGKQREWSTEDRDFAGSIADLLALRIQSAETRELRAAFLTEQSRMIAQEKAASLEQLAAGIAHDFRNLLAVVVSYAEMLSARTDLPAEASMQCQEIGQAAKRGVNLATDLLAFANPAERPPTVLQLADVVAEYLPLLQTTAGSTHPIHYERPVVLGNVLMDKIQFMRLLMNLVANAREAMPHGGAITLRLRSIRLTGDPTYNGRYVLLEISDHGTGMDEVTQQRIFEPYFTTKPKGTGLGLATVKQIVERVGGLIRVESTVGQGTTFRLFFPSIGASNGGSGQYEIPPELRET